MQSTVFAYRRNALFRAFGYLIALVFWCAYLVFMMSRAPAHAKEPDIITVFVTFIMPPIAAVVCLIAAVFYTRKAIYRLKQHDPIRLVRSFFKELFKLLADEDSENEPWPILCDAVIFAEPMAPPEQVQALKTHWETLKSSLTHYCISKLVGKDPSEVTCISCGRWSLISPHAKEVLAVSDVRGNPLSQ